MITKHASRFILEPDSIWSTTMRARYGDWTHDSPIRPPQRCSYLWKEICSRSGIVMEETIWMIGDGSSVRAAQDPWIDSIPISRWPTFVSTDLPYQAPVSDLICHDQGGWSVSEVTRLFGPPLTDRILSLPISTSRASDARTWRQSAQAIAPTRDIICLMRPNLDAPLDVAWIWKLHVHPRVRLFLWKVAWDRLPTCFLLQRRSVISDTCCPVCGLAEETTEHAILLCPRAILIWHTVGCSTWETSTGRYREAFLDSLRHGSGFGVTLPAYIAYHIWLARNRQVFTSQILTPSRILRSATALAHEFSDFDTSGPLDTPGIWDSHAASAASRSAVLIHWEPPPPGFVKINFDGSVRGLRGGAGFVIRDSSSRLLGAGGIPLNQTSVIGAELHAAWAAITYTVRTLRATKLYIEGDAVSVIDWMTRRAMHRGPANPLLQDIWSALRTVSSAHIRHVYREVNCAADWVASHSAIHASAWSWTEGDRCPPELQAILYADLLGLIRTRMV